MAEWYNQSGSDNDSFFSSSTSETDEEKDEVQPTINPDYMDLMDSGDDSVDDKRVIKSAKVKRWEELQKITKNIQQKKSVNDWAAIFEEWGDMLKCIEKAKNVVAEHGLPRFVVAIFLQLEDFINETSANKDLVRNMKKQNATAFHTVRMRFKKYLESEVHGIKAKMTEWRESKKEYDGEDFESSEETKVVDDDDLFGSDSGEGSEEAPAPQKKSQDLRDEDIKWTQEKVDKKVSEMLLKRGTKAYDKKQHYKDFTFLREKSEGLNNQITIDFHILNVLHDLIPQSTTISLKLWTQTYNLLVKLLSYFVNDPELKLYETKDEFHATFGIETDVSPLPANAVLGHLLHSLEKIGDEYTSALQAAEAPSEQYITWLAHENPLVKLYDFAQKYYTNNGDYKRATVIAQKMLHYISYRHETAEKGQADPNVSQTTIDSSANDAAEDEEGNPLPVAEEVEETVVLQTPASVKDDWNITELVPQLCSFVCRHHPEDRQKRYSILELVYHYAIHDKYFEARDLLLMTHLQEKIHKAKPALQVLFNRATIQLGLAAFRIGRIQDAHNCLQEICSSGRIKELLAQGINVRYQVEKSKEQEKQEQRRQIPYHMQINLELVEFVHLVCAMLLEVPNMAQSRDREQRRRVISKYFIKIMEYYDLQVFTGPPESVRETILVAAKSLERGDWKACKDLILSLPVIQLLPNGEAMKELLAKEIQEQALRTYLFAYGQYYDSLSLDHLSSMFDLDQNVAHSIISKLIISEELAGSWDQPTGALLIHTQDPTPLQLQALSYADKINILLESVDGSEQRSFEHRRMVAAAAGLTAGRTGPAQITQTQPGKKTTPTVGAIPATAAGQRKPVVAQERGFTQRRGKKVNTFNKK